MAKKIEFHRCSECKISFRTSSAFNAHECVRELENESLEELMRRYNTQRAGGR